MTATHTRVPGPITLTLPSPPSLNSLYRTAGGRTYKVKKAKDYDARVRTLFGHLTPIPDDWDVALEGAWYRPRQTGDLDNAMKQLGDSLQGIAYVNDNQIQAIHVTRHDDPQDPRFEVTVSVVGPRPKRKYRKARKG